MNDKAQFKEAVNSASKYANERSRTGNYEVHYPAVLDFFSMASERGWDANKVIQGCLIVYGWMPTILEGRKKTGKMNLESATRFSQKLENYIHKRTPLEDCDFKFVNDSYIGTSKFLHFMQPCDFAIWDINVARALTGNPEKASALSHHMIDKIDLVKMYQARVSELARNGQYGSVRNIEMLLFHQGQDWSQKKSGALTT